MFSGKKLTNSEQKAAALACDGLSNKAIAKRLGLTESTVKVHLSSVFKKVGVRGRGALIVKWNEKR